jgi:hypothetical protein
MLQNITKELGIFSTASSCKHSTETSGSIKGGKFLDYMSVLLFSKEELCPVELVIFSRVQAWFYPFLYVFLCLSFLHIDPILFFSHTFLIPFTLILLLSETVYFQSVFILFFFVCFPFRLLPSIQRYFPLTSVAIVNTNYRKTMLNIVHCLK